MAHRPETISVHTYLESDIGCCTDYAYMLKFLLDREGIPNRLCAFPGHIFNEVQLEGRWCIVDATTSLLLHASWEEVQQAPEILPEPIQVTIFPHDSMTEDPPEAHRPVVGRFQLWMLIMIANRTTGGMTPYYPALPAWFR